MVCMFLLIGVVSATKINYENNDMKVNFKKSFLGIGTGDLGSIELKSHKSVDEIKQVSIGEQVVMWYEFDWKELHKDGLGEVEFIDMRTGEIVYRDYSFVYLKEGECKKVNFNNGTKSNQCSKDEWLPYNIRDIPKGKTIIGIEVEVKKRDHIDGVWIVSGKEISRHAEWTETGVESYTNTITDAFGTASLTISLFQNTSFGFVKAFGIHRANGGTASVYRVHVNQSGSNLATKDISIEGTDNDIEYANFTNTDYSDAITEGAFTIDLHRISGDIDLDWETSTSYEGTYFSFYDQTILKTTSGRTLTYADVALPEEIVIVQNSPIDYYNTSNPTIDFSFNVTSNKKDVQNATLYIDGVLNETNTTGINGTYIIQKILGEGEHNWSVLGFNNESSSESSLTRFLTIDSTPPQVTILNPIGTITYAKKGGTLDLNFTIEDTSLETCWFNYNGTNITIANCAINTTFALQETGFNNLTLYANDSLGNENSSFTLWDIKVQENSVTFNTTSFETKTEFFIVDISANSSLTAVTLDYNGTDKTMTQSGTNWTTSFDIPEDVINRTFKFEYTYAGDTITSTPSYQDITVTNFSICDASLTNKFLNLSFKDEQDLSVINASITTSTFEYYLGSGTVTKTFSFINITNNYNYEFCATPNQTLNVDSFIQYKQGAAYPQRVFDALVIQYTNQTTNSTLYLLGVSDGIFVTFQTINTANLVLSGVAVKAIREISGGDVVVGQGTTGGDGGVTLWLNPDFIHDFTFSKSGFPTLENSFAPTQSAYTITLGGTTALTDSLFKGITFNVLPTNTSLVNDTTYTFGFTLTSTFWDIGEYGFNLRLANGTIITGDTTTTSGTALTKSYDTNNQTKIYLDYFWKVNSTYTNGTKIWIVQNTENTQWGISTFFKDLNLYLDSGLFGLDNFGRYLLVFILIFFTVGIMSFKYGFTSPMTISVMTFLIVFFFDVVVGIIPSLSLPNGNAVPYLLTFITGLIASIAVLREATRV